MHTLTTRQEAMLRQCLSSDEIRERIKAAGFVLYNTIKLGEPVEFYSRKKNRQSKHLFLSTIALENGRGKHFVTRELVESAMTAGTTPILPALTDERLANLIA